MYIRERGSQLRILESLRERKDRKSDLKSHFRDLIYVQSARADSLTLERQTQKLYPLEHQDTTARHYPLECNDTRSSVEYTRPVFLQTLDSRSSTIGAARAKTPLEREKHFCSIFADAQNTE